MSSFEHDWLIDEREEEAAADRDFWARVRQEEQEKQEGADMFGPGYDWDAAERRLAGLQERASRGSDDA